jgi:hypothetical protein
MCSHWELSENVTQFDYSKLYTAADITKTVLYTTTVLYLFLWENGIRRIGVRRLKRIGFKGTML